MRFRVGSVLLATVLLSGIASAQQYQAFVLQSPDTVENLAQGACNGAGAGSYYSFTGSGLLERAMYWSNLTGAAVCLNPSTATYSYANTLMGVQVGGSINSPATNGGEHAVLWLDGTSDNFVDLDPPTFNGNFSSVFGMDSSTQVGYAKETYSGAPYFSYHPILWSGTAASAVDLMPNLPGVSHGIAAACAGGQQV